MSENNEVTRKEFEEMKAQIKENNLMLKEMLSTLDIIMNGIKTTCIACICNKENKWEVKEINKVIMLMHVTMSFQSRELQRFYSTESYTDEQKVEAFDTLLNILNETQDTEKEHKKDLEPGLFDWLEQNVDKFKEMENIFKDTTKPN